jgi:hypothetical protein
MIPPIKKLNGPRRGTGRPLREPYFYAGILHDYAFSVKWKESKNAATA